MNRRNTSGGKAPTHGNQVALKQWKKLVTYRIDEEQPQENNALLHWWADHLATSRLSPRTKAKDLNRLHIIARVCDESRAWPLTPIGSGQPLRELCSEDFAVAQNRVVELDSWIDQHYPEETANELKTLVSRFARSYWTHELKRKGEPHALKWFTKHDTQLPRVPSEFLLTFEMYLKMLQQTLNLGTPTGFRDALVLSVAFSGLRPEDPHNMNWGDLKVQLSSHPVKGTTLPLWTCQVVGKKQKKRELRDPCPLVHASPLLAEWTRRMDAVGISEEEMRDAHLAHPTNFERGGKGGFFESITKKNYDKIFHRAFERFDTPEFYKLRSDRTIRGNNRTGAIFRKSFATDQVMSGVSWNELCESMEWGYGSKVAKRYLGIGKHTAVDAALKQMGASAIGNPTQPLHQRYGPCPHCQAWVPSAFDICIICTKDKTQTLHNSVLDTLGATLQEVKQVNQMNQLQTAEVGAALAPTPVVTDGGGIVQQTLF